MKLTREEYMSAISSIVGDRTDDEALAFVENMTDTFNDGNSEELEKANATIADLNTKLADLDADWRKKYRDRFYAGTEEEENPSNQPLTEDKDESALDPEEITVDDLFD